MRQFVDARKGRAIPFWLPSWQQDLTLKTAAVEDQALLELNWIRYTGLMYPNTSARRHLAIYSAAHSMDFHYVDDAEDPGDELAESITIDPVATRALPIKTTILSFLKLCRLEADEVPWIWESTQVLHALIQCREIPAEAPYVV